MARGDLIDVGYGTMSSPRTMCCSGFQWRYANTSAEAINTNSDIIEIFPYILRTATNYTPYSNDLRNSYVQITIGSSTTTQYLKTKYNFGNVSPINTKFHLTSEYNSSNPFGYGTPDSQTYLTSRTIDGKTAYGARFTVPHNTDGSAPTVSVKWVMVNSSSHSNIEKTQPLTLDSIPRASKPTCANVTLGNAVTIYTNRVSTNFSHKLVIKIGSTTIQTITVAKANENYSWTPAISTYAPYIIKNPPTATATIECTTYNGDTQTDAYKVGTMQSTTCVLTVPQNSHTKPSASISIAEADTTMISKNWGVYVQGKSKLAVTVNGEENEDAGTPSASITGYNSTLNISSSSTPFNTHTYTTGILSASGNIKATVSDARGFSSEEVQKSFTVQPYSTPTITSYSVARCTSNGTLSDTGTYIKYTFKASISSVSNKNSKSFTLKYKSTGSYTNIYTYSSGYSVNQVDVVYNANLSTSTVYTFRFEVTDSFTTTPQEVTVLAEPDLLNFHKSGKSMAIGGISQRGDSEKALDVFIPTYLQSGGQFSGTQGNSWVKARDTAYVRDKGSSSTGYRPLISAKTPTGEWSIGNFDNENLLFSYTTDANYTANNNVSNRYSLGTNGYFSGSCASASSATSAGSATTWSGNTSLTNDHATLNTGDTWMPVISSGKIQHTLRKFASSKTHTDYNNNQSYIPTMSFLTYWNGAYNSSNNSNLTYCTKGEIASFTNHERYSTSEQAIGTWIDGKVIYRKVISKTSGITTGNNTIAHGISNFNQLITAYGAGYLNNMWQPLNRVVTDAITKYGTGIGDVNATNLLLQIGTSYTTRTSVYIVLEYTKTS